MRSYKRYTRRKRLLKQIAVVALSPNRVFTKEQIYQHIYEEAESEVNNRIYGLIKNLLFIYCFFRCILIKRGDKSGI